MENSKIKVELENIKIQFPYFVGQEIKKFKES